MNPDVSEKRFKDYLKQFKAINEETDDKIKQWLESNEEFINEVSSPMLLRPSIGFPGDDSLRFCCAPILGGILSTIFTTDLLHQTLKSLCNSESFLMFPIAGLVAFLIGYVSTPAAITGFYKVKNKKWRNEHNEELKKKVETCFKAIADAYISLD